MSVQLPTGIEVGNTDPIDYRQVVGPGERYVNLAAIPATVTRNGQRVWDENETTDVARAKIYTGTTGTNVPGDWRREADILTSGGGVTGGVTSISAEAIAGTELDWVESLEGAATYVIVRTDGVSTIPQNDRG